MPDYLERNALDAQQDLPAWFWTGDTDMACLRDALAQTLAHGYANHIQRLMVTGLYTLMLGVQPQQVHAWYLAVYVDAVEWVELPNTLGMSQYADGGVMGSKPYIATGKYIQRMSPHCKGCRYDPAQRSGDRACPFTTLYWDFLMRHEAALARNPRMALQVKNVARLTDAQKQAVSERAAAIRGGEAWVSHMHDGLRCPRLAQRRPASPPCGRPPTHARATRSTAPSASCRPTSRTASSRCAEVLAGVAARHALDVQHKFVYELGWRAYFRHVWQHRGDGILQSLHEGPLPDDAYARELPADIRQACTGVPVVDEAVRTLYATGMLHNHARMWLASYVVHVRKVHWRVGADWLYGHLLDGDLASNHLSWQWVAGTGSSKPYLFNADNVARYAPAPWHSPGSVIDTSYEALDRHGAPAACATRPGRTAHAGRPSRRRSEPRLAGRAARRTRLDGS